MKRTSLVAAATGAAALLGAASAHAVTFADYGAVDQNANLEWTQSGTTSGSLGTTGVGASADTIFSFLTPALSSLKNLPAMFTLSATAPSSDAAVSDSFGQLAEQNLSGAFSFIYEGAAPLTVGSHTYMTGANLLSGTFSGAELVGPANGSTTSFQDAIFSGGTVTFTSDIAQFADTGDKGLSLSLTSVLPAYFASAGQSLNSFTAVSTGSFSSDLASNGGGGGIPEPATWALMLVGFGGAGAAVRSQKRRTAMVRI
jgi:hypothetical protein